MNSQVQTVAMVFSVIEPVFGWYLLILFQSNFLAVRSQNDDAGLFNEAVGGRYLMMVGLSVLLYGGIFIFVTEGGLWWMLSTLWSVAVRGAANGVGRKPPASGTGSLRAVRPVAAASATAAGAVADDAAKTPSVLPPFATVAKGSAATTSNPASVRFPVAVTPSASTAAVAARRDDDAPLRSVAGIDPDVVAERERVQQVLQCGQLDTQQSAISFTIYARYTMHVERYQRRSP